MNDRISLVTLAINDNNIDNDNVNNNINKNNINNNNINKNNINNNSNNNNKFNNNNINNIDSNNNNISNGMDYENEILDVRNNSVIDVEKNDDDVIVPNFNMAVSSFSLVGGDGEYVCQDYNNNFNNDNGLINSNNINNNDNNSNNNIMNAYDDVFTSAAKDDVTSNNNNNVNSNNNNNNDKDGNNDDDDDDFVDVDNDEDLNMDKVEEMFNESCSEVMCRDSKCLKLREDFTNIERVLSSGHPNSLIEDRYLCTLFRLAVHNGGQHGNDDDDVDVIIGRIFKTYIEFNHSTFNEAFWREGLRYEVKGALMSFGHVVAFASSRDPDLDGHRSTFIIKKTNSRQFNTLNEILKMTTTTMIKGTHENVSKLLWYLSIGDMDTSIQWISFENGNTLFPPPQMMQPRDLATHVSLARGLLEGSRYLYKQCGIYFLNFDASAMSYNSSQSRVVLSDFSKILPVGRLNYDDVDEDDFQIFLQSLPMNTVSPKCVTGHSYRWHLRHECFDYAFEKIGKERGVVPYQPECLEVANDKLMLFQLLREMIDRHFSDRPPGLSDIANSLSLL
ncbi:hypothetical protein HELRODRAFT_178870 [Helobdella robusta]|uniref:Protein kinase domain-containing protein n=1 Tax=Helobdella robusta TaxID=6412 RepID=T1FDU5_HELRO|nr:hypothetical protein HELRODRAFT_178870 [Helobdella robusta]ESN95952.1 hypothetical protein HELRODRAFT_178870 [Helobdella robusta]